ncbi:hypothetical protein RI054_34g133420 [Pseudoscourfieldia marina]
MAGSRRVARSRRLADRRLADIDKDISPGTRVKKRFSTDAGMEWYHGRVTSVREADAYPICVTYDDGEKESYDRAEFHRDVVVCRDAVTPPRVPPASDEHDKRRRRDDDTPNSARASTGRRRPRKRQSRPSATAAQGRRLAIDFEEHARSHSEDTCPPAFTTTASATTTTETQITTTETQSTITETETRSTSTTCERCRGWRAEEFDAHAYDAFTAMLMRSEADRVQAGCGTGVAGAHGPYQVTIDDGVRVVRSRDCKGVLHDVRGHRCQACSGVTVKHIKRDVHNALNAKSNNFKHALLHGSAHQSMKDAATSRKALAMLSRTSLAPFRGNFEVRVSVSVRKYTRSASFASCVVCDEELSLSPSLRVADAPSVPCTGSSPPDGAPVAIQAACWSVDWSVGTGREFRG